MPWYDPDLKLTYELHAAGDLAGGMAACERLLSRPGLPADIEGLVRRNQTWHTRNLARAGQGPFNEPPYWRDQELSVPAYVDAHGIQHDSSFNPSIAEWGGETFCIVRSSNYRITPEGRYDIRSDALVISTANHLLQLDPGTLRQGTGRVINDEEHREHTSPFPVRGHEDCRLFYRDEVGWMYSATVRDRSEELGIAQMLEARLDPTTGRVIHSRLLSDARRHEKNWMPWNHGWESGEGYVYSVEPTLILDTWFRDPQRDYGVWFNGPHLLRHCRGGTQVVPWEAGKSLCLVHESVVFDQPYRKVYTHRLVAFDHNGRVVGYSEPFTFRGMGIEFAAGLVVRPESGEAIISYGVDDERAYLLRLELSELTGLLREVA